MDDGSDPQPNPWLTIWLDPRGTIRRIVEHDPKQLVLLLASLSGMSQTLNSAAQRSIGDDLALPYILASVIIGGPISGLIGLYLGSWLLKLTGGWVGGRADALRIRTAIAWGSVPTVWGLVLWIALVLVFRQELFASASPLRDSSVALTAFYMLASAAQIVIGIWAVVVFLHCLGQVQGFSAWRALGNVAAAVAIVIVPIVILVLLVADLPPQM